MQIVSYTGGSTKDLGQENGSWISLNLPDFIPLTLNHVDVLQNIYTKLSQKKMHTEKKNKTNEPNWISSWWFNHTENY